MRRGPVTPRSGPAWSGARKFGCTRNGGLRRSAAFGRARSALAVTAAPGAGELKFHDIAVDDATIAQGAVIQNGGSVCLIGQAITESTRIGRKCTIKSINWHYEVNMLERDSVASPPNTDVVRVMMYLDRQANGATAVNTDLLEDAGTASLAYQSFNNLSNKNRFRILHDQMFDMNYQVGMGDGATSEVLEQARSGSFYSKCNIPVEFSGTANPSVIGELSSNNIGVMLVSKSGTAGFVSKLRLRFSDA